MVGTFFKKRFLIISVLLVVGFFIFFFGLGSTGLVDETPSLFASAGRTMSQSGDWLTPKVNGILRFDKPPLYYWFMAVIYSLPGNQNWDSLGSLSARLPSAFSALILMIMIADTLLCHLKSSKNNIYLSLLAALCFGLSPLVVIWSRAAVSDSLLCSTLGISLLCFWRKIESDNQKNTIFPWIMLGLAILSKGPVALIIVFLTLGSFFSTRKDWPILLRKINPLRGIIICSIVSLPWFLIQTFKEGKVFLDNFFGYHNLQRYITSVNNHSEPWWFYFYILIIASLPFSIFLFHGVFETIRELIIDLKNTNKSNSSLFLFSLCWFFSVLFFFSLSGTKLPSYWLPAVPAASILIAKSAEILSQKKVINLTIWAFTTFICFGLSFAFYFSDYWLSLINDPEMPNLASEIKDIGLLTKARTFTTILSIISLLFTFKFVSRSIIYLQISVLLGQFFIMQPIRNLADALRQLPVRNISKQIKNIRDGGEPLAMIGIRKPSLHFYSQKIVFYESNSPSGIINLSERFADEKRSNELDNPDYASETILIVIDKYSKDNYYWSKMNHQELGVYSIYKLIRIKKKNLIFLANQLKNEGFKSDWRLQKYEKF